jgi:hypothetical protein
MYFWNISTTASYKYYTTALKTVKMSQIKLIYDKLISKNLFFRRLVMNLFLYILLINYWCYYTKFYSSNLLYVLYFILELINKYEMKHTFYS